MISVRIITPQGVYLNCDVKAINCVSVEGALTIYPNHVPLVLILKTSKFTLIQDDRQEFAISGGTLSFSDNVATILTDSIESKDEIDVERAQRAKEKALENLKKAKESLELKKAELALSKAINRLNVKEIK